MRVRKSIWLWLIGALALVGVAMLFVDTIPPHSVTHLSMHMGKRRVLRYAQEHGRLPSALGDTKAIEGFHSSIKDGWGTPLEYRVDTNGLVMFRSLGRDRRLGGDGDHADMVGSFPAKKADGSWSDEFVDWTHDPFDELRRQRPNDAPEDTARKLADLQR